MEYAEKLLKGVPGPFIRAPLSDPSQVHLASSGDLNCGRQALTIPPVVEGGKAITTGVRG